MNRAKCMKLTALVTILIFAVTCFTMSVGAKQVFSDLTAQHWCYSKIIDFNERGFVCGYEDGTFRPDRTITRAEYVKIVNNFFGYELDTEHPTNFKDVTSDDWFYPYVNEAVERGYITGYPDGTFRPQDPIRRQEATVILSRILKIDNEEYPANHADGLAQYSDGNEVEEWARKAIHSYSVYNFINGYEDGTLRILQNVTRAETVELLNILEQKVVIERGGGGGSTTKLKVHAPSITLWKNENEKIQVADGQWINAEMLANTPSGEALVNIISSTKGSTIHETLSGRSGERTYTTKDTENDLENAFPVKDGIYEVSAYATKSGSRDSDKSTKTVKVDTVAPIAKGIDNETSVTIFVEDNDLYELGNEYVSGLDKAYVAWFVLSGDEYVRESSWTNVNSGDEIPAPTVPGVYYVGVRANDVAGNKIGDRFDTLVSDTLNEEPTNEPFELLKEKELTEDVPPIEIEIEVEAEITINYIYDDKEPEVKKDHELPGNRYVAEIEEDENYTYFGDNVIEVVSRNNEENVIDIYFTRILVTVKYLPNSGSGEMEDSKFSAGTSGELSANTFVKAGYSFVCWSGDNGKTYEDKATFEAKNNETEVELYAIWAPENINYVEETYKEKLDGTFECTNSETKSGEVDTRVEMDIEEYEGFTFNEDDERNVLEGVINPEEELVLKTYYNRNKYKITYVVDDEEYSSGEGKFEEEVNVEEKPEAREGYTFDGWYDESGEKITEDTIEVPANDVTITGNWIVNEYKITYIVDDKEYASTSGDYGEEVTVEPIPEEREGYTFDGWYDENGDKITEDTIQIPASDIEIIGNWVVNAHKVYYYINNEIYASYDKNYNEQVKVDKIPDTRIGYEFIGWNTDDVEIDSHGKFVMPDDDVRFDAEWVAACNFMVVYWGENLESAQEWTDEYTDATFTEPSQINEVHVENLENLTGSVLNKNFVTIAPTKLENTIDFEDIKDDKDAMIEATKDNTLGNGPEYIFYDCRVRDCKDGEVPVVDVYYVRRVYFYRFFDDVPVNGTNGSIEGTLGKYGLGTEGLGNCYSNYEGLSVDFLKNKLYKVSEGSDYTDDNGNRHSNGYLYYKYGTSTIDSWNGYEYLDVSGERWDTMLSWYIDDDENILIRHELTGENTDTWEKSAGEVALPSTKLTRNVYVRRLIPSDKNVSYIFTILPKDGKTGDNINKDYDLSDINKNLVEGNDDNIILNCIKVETAKTFQLDYSFIPDGYVYNYYAISTDQELNTSNWIKANSTPGQYANNGDNITLDAETQDGGVYRLYIMAKRKYYNISIDRVAGDFVSSHDVLYGSSLEDVFDFEDAESPIAGYVFSHFEDGVGNLYYGDTIEEGYEEFIKTTPNIGSTQITLIAYWKPVELRLSR